MTRGSDLDRVHFYSEHDLATPFEVDKILNRLRSINPYGDITDLNDVMELWNIHQYSKKKLLPIKLEGADKEYLNDITNKLQGIIVQSMLKWPKEDFEIEYEKLIYDYQHNFWKVIVETNTYKQFHKPVLMNCIKNSSNYALRSILVEKVIVNYLDKELATFLKESIHAVEVLLGNYSVSISTKGGKVCLPSALTMSEREEMIVKYVNSTERNLNYLRIISTLKNDNDLTISDRTRLLCKRAEHEDNNKVLREGQSMSYKIGFKADYKKVDPIIEITDAGVTYNLGCLKDIDATGILFLFKHIFVYIDLYGTVPFTSLDQEDTIYDIFGLRGVSCYRTTPLFYKKNNISQMQLIAIEKGLELYGQEFESILLSIIEWINVTYSINIRFSTPSEKGSVLSKIRHLFAEMDSLIKQYQLYVEDGSIDYELLGMSSSPLGLNQIKSALYPRPKYVNIHANSSEIKWFQELLCSNNSTFSKEGKHGHESLYTQIKHGKQIELEYSFQQDHINKLIEKGIINLSSKGGYEVTTVGELLNILYHNEFVMIDRLPIDISKTLPSIEAFEWIEYSSTLLHIKEANYFNYWLNKKDFSNGYDLRNRYMHGVQTLEEKGIESDYRIAKKLFILLLLKIIDDLELNKTKRT